MPLVTDTAINMSQGIQIFLIPVVDPVIHTPIIERLGLVPCLTPLEIPLLGEKT